MSKLEARKYTSIRNLREEIRQDMRDYQLLCSDDNNRNYYFPLINELSDHDVIGFSFTLESKYCWFYDHLKQKIKDNLIKLKEINLNFENDVVIL